MLVRASQSHREPSIVSANMPSFITFKRWTLREGRKESELVELVCTEIAPHYKKLPGFLRLGLLHVKGTRSYLALQYWHSRGQWLAMTDSDYYHTWHQEYVPILNRWNEIMEFEEEWEVEDLLESCDST